MRNLRQILTAVILILLAASASYAGTISEDVTYWFKTANGTDSMMNPTTDWLKQNTANLLVKVQQTVYDQVSSVAMLNRNNPGEGTAHPGYLYAYSLTNLNVGNLADLSDKGITNFGVEWHCSYYATTSRQMPTGWVVDTAATTGPSWKWTPADPGMLPGDTVGGFWAVSNVGVDGVTKANIVQSLANGQLQLSGNTTGPCPEPGSIVSLFAGMAGLGLTVMRRRKK